MRPSRRRRLRFLGSALCAGLLFGMLPTAAAAAEPTAPSCPEDLGPAVFDDRDEIAEVHRAAVDCVAHLGVADGLGYDEGVRYLPDAVVRRDQMASFIARALDVAGASLPAADDQGFGDIAGNVHEERVRQLAAAGVAAGTSSSTYSPEQHVTRGQMASFLLRAVAWFRDTPVDELAGGPTRFDDVVDTTHQGAIAGVYHLGIASGTESGPAGAAYGPGQTVTRGQMASFLVATLEALHADPARCTNHEAGYALTMPDGWHTNAGAVVSRCTVVARDRFVLESGTQLPNDLPVRVTVEDVDLPTAVDQPGHDELDRRVATIAGREAIVVESRSTGDGLLSEGVTSSTYFVDVSDGTAERTLVASTNSLADDFATNRDALAGMMDTLVLGSSARVDLADFEGGGRPFSVDAWTAGRAGLCTQVIAGTAVDTLCEPQGDLGLLEIRVHHPSDDLAVLAGSVATTVDRVEVVTVTGEVRTPELVAVGRRRGFASPITPGDIDRVRARRNGEVVATADAPS